MRITILGANSYIARNLIWMLQGSGEHTLFLYDYQEKQLDGAAGYEALQVLDATQVERIHFDVDLIYLFIGKTGTVQGFEDCDTFVDINEKALLHVLNAMQHTGSTAKLIFPSTRLVYKGKPGALPENSEKEFKTVYAINKYACEQYLEMYHRMYGITYCIFRICVPFGTMIPGATSYGTAEFMLGKANNGENISLYGDGSVRRTLTHMEDLCRVLWLAGSDPSCKNDVYNIGGEDYSLADMAKLIAKCYGVGVDYVPWPENALKIESGDTVFDDTKLKALVDVKYLHTFGEWVKKA